MERDVGIDRKGGMEWNRNGTECGECLERNGTERGSWTGKGMEWKVGVERYVGMERGKDTAVRKERTQVQGYVYKFFPADFFLAQVYARSFSERDIGARGSI